MPPSLPSSSSSASSSSLSQLLFPRSSYVTSSSISPTAAASANVLSLSNRVNVSVAATPDSRGFDRKTSIEKKKRRNNKKQAITHPLTSHSAFPSPFSSSTSSLSPSSSISRSQLSSPPIRTMLSPSTSYSSKKQDKHRSRTLAAPTPRPAPPSTPCKSTRSIQNNPKTSSLLYASPFVTSSSNSSSYTSTSLSSTSSPSFSSHPPNHPHSHSFRGSLSTPLQPSQPLFAPSPISSRPQTPLTTSSSSTASSFLMPPPLHSSSSSPSSTLAVLSSTTSSSSSLSLNKILLASPAPVHSSTLHAVPLTPLSVPITSTTLSSFSSSVENPISASSVSTPRVLFHGSSISSASTLTSVTPAPISASSSPTVASPSSSSFFETEFENLGKIGSGEFGIVYKCRSRSDNQLYAIKQSARQFRSQAERQRALREVRSFIILSRPPSSYPITAATTTTSSSSSAVTTTPLIESSSAASEPDSSVLNASFPFSSSSSHSDSFHNLSFETAASLPSSSTSSSVSSFIYAHPNVVTCYRAWEEDNYLFLQHELLPFGTIRDCLNRADEPISETLIWNWLGNILCGLEWIHSHGLIHNDLKPDNMFLTENSWVKIGDLGISRAIRNTSSPPSLSSPSISAMDISSSLSSSNQSSVAILMDQSNDNETQQTSLNTNQDIDIGIENDNEHPPDLSSHPSNFSSTSSSTSPSLRVPTLIDDFEEGDCVYVAPEVLDSHLGPVGTAADIFSLGLTLFEICADVILPKEGQAWSDLRHERIDWSGSEWLITPESPSLSLPSHSSANATLHSSTGPPLAPPTSASTPFHSPLHRSSSFTSPPSQQKTNRTVSASTVASTSIMSPPPRPIFSYPTNQQISTTFSPPYVSPASATNSLNKRASSANINPSVSLLSPEESHGGSNAITSNPLCSFSPSHSSVAFSSPSRSLSSSHTSPATSLASPSPPPSTPVDPHSLKPSQTPSIFSHFANAYSTPITKKENHHHSFTPYQSSTSAMKRRQSLNGSQSGATFTSAFSPLTNSISSSAGLTVVRSDELKEVITAMLRRDPSQRPTVAELMQHPMIAPIIEKHKQHPQWKAVMQSQIIQMNATSYFHFSDDQVASNRLRISAPQQSSIHRKRRNYSGTASFNDEIEENSHSVSSSFPNHSSYCKIESHVSRDLSHSLATETTPGPRKLLFASDGED